MKAKGSFSKTVRSHWVEIAVGATSFAAILGLCLWLALKPKAGAEYAEVIHQGKVAYTLRLDEARELELPTSHGHVHIGVKDHKVAVLSSPCPSQYCVHQGYKGNQGESIVCAYEGVAIYLLGDSGTYEVSV